MKISKVYLAAMYSRRDELREHAKELRKLGIEVTSRWLRERQDLNTSLKDVTDNFGKKTAVQDLEDIDAGDTFIAFSIDPDVPSVRGGRHVEFGYALAKGKHMIVLGPRENIFHFDPRVVQFDTFDQFIEMFSIYGIKI